VLVGDVLRLVKCIVTINGKMEEAIKFVKIDDLHCCLCAPSVY
jgi:hypothetical protein